MEAASVQTVGAPTDRRRSKGIPERRLAKLMVAPSMILIAVVAAYPIIYAIWLSLHEYSVRQAGLSRWAGSLGLRNYSSRPAVVGVVGGVQAHAHLHRRVRDVGAVHRPGHGPGDARGVPRAGRPAHRRARPVGDAHGRHGDHLADDVRVAVRLREHGPGHADRLARLRAPGADHHHPRRRLENGAVHGVADPRRVAGDTRRGLRGGRGRRRLGVAAVHAGSRCRC